MSVRSAQNEGMFCCRGLAVEFVAATWYVNHSGQSENSRVFRHPARGLYKMKKAIKKRLKIVPIIGEEKAKQSERKFERT
ncbi:MAG: hypothetical protein ACR2PG_23645 [Hyphomicrobiaceae bacterium]